MGVPIYLPNRFRGIGTVDTLAKNIVRGVSVQQQQQLSCEILTNLPIITSINTRYYRKSAFEIKGKKLVKVHIAIIQGIYSNNLGYTE